MFWKLATLLFALLCLIEGVLLFGASGSETSQEPANNGIDNAVIEQLNRRLERNEVLLTQLLESMRWQAVTVAPASDLLPAGQSANPELPENEIDQEMREKASLVVDEAMNDGIFDPVTFEALQARVAAEHPEQLGAVMEEVSRRINSGELRMYR